MKLFVRKPHCFITCASLLISGAALVSSCKKQFSAQEASDAGGLNTVLARASFLSTSTIGSQQVFTVPNALFNGTAAVVTDATGNIFIADSVSHVIRKISLTGTISVFAGTANNPNLTDGQGAAARFNKPVGLAIDTAGNLYVADKGNHAVRKITPDSVVTTLAGKGFSGTVDGPHDIAQFNMPSGVAVDAAGNVYVADAGNNKIRKIKSTDGSVNTFSGNGTVGHNDDVNALAQFNYPTGVALDASGTKLYVADAGNNKIRIISGGLTDTYAGGGTIGDVPGFKDAADTAARFNKPMSVTIDATQNVFVADNKNNRIRKISPDKAVTTYAGTGGADLLDAVPASASFDYANSVAVDPSGNIYVVDAYCEVRKIDAQTGMVSTFAGGQGGYVDGTGAAAQFRFPDQIAFDAAGNLYVADQMNNRIRKITPAGVVTTFAGSGATSTFFVTGGGYADGPALQALFVSPTGIAIDNAGNIYVGEYGNHRLRKITPDGIVHTLSGNGIQGFKDGSANEAEFGDLSRLAVDNAGNVYVADNTNKCIRKVTPNGTVSTLAGGSAKGYRDGPAASSQFSDLLGVAVDGNGIVYVADGTNNRIRKITPDGIVSSIAGFGPPMGIGTTYADGPGYQARFTGTYDIAIGPTGALYVMDFFNSRVRKVQ